MAVQRVAARMSERVAVQCVAASVSEWPSAAAASSRAEGRLDTLQVREHAPEQLIGHRHVAMFARIVAIFARMRGGPPANHIIIN